MARTDARSCRTGCPLASGSHEHLRPRRRSAAADRRLRPRGSRPERLQRLRAQVDDHPPARCGRGGPRRGRRLRRRRPRDRAEERGRFCRSPAIGRCARCPSTSRRSTSSPKRRSARCRSCIASGRTSRRRSTSRCARPASRCTRCSGGSPRPLTFVVSLRLGEPPSLEPVTRRLERYPTLRFKLDPTVSWDEELIAGLIATGAVDSVDFKGLYEGTPVDQPADPQLYARVDRGLPGRLDRGSEAHAGDRRAADPASRPHHVGREHPLDRRHRVAPVRAAHGQPQAVPAGRHQAALRRLRLHGTSAASAPTAAASSSLASAAGRSSTSPRSSTPTRRTTRRRRASTSPNPPAGLPSSPLPPTPSATGFRWA